MREGTRNFMVGITSITALVGLAVLMMRFGEIDEWLHPKYDLTIHTAESAGLRPGGNVEFNGVPIGVVDEVSIQSNPEFPVRIKLLINQDTDLPSTAVPYSITPIIGGSSRLQFQAEPLPSGATAGTFPKDGSAEIRGPIKGGLLDALTKQLDARMEPIVRSLEAFNTLSATYVDLGKNLNSLMAPQSPQEIAGGAEPNIRTAVLKLNTALDEINEALRLAKDWLGDEQMRADARSAVNKASKLIDNATVAVEKYAKLAESLEGNATEITRKLLPVADQLSTTLEEVRRLTKAAHEGEGTVGRLMSNPDLYNSLNDAAIRLECTLVEVQLLIEKFKKEGVPINF